MGNPPPGQPPLRVRWHSLQNPNGATGRVTATRLTLLQGWVEGFDRYNLHKVTEFADYMERVRAQMALRGASLGLHLFGEFIDLAWGEIGRQLKAFGMQDGYRRL